MYSEGLERLLDNTEPCMRGVVERYVTFPGLHHDEMFECQACGTVCERKIRGGLSKWCPDCRGKERHARYAMNLTGITV